MKPTPGHKGLPRALGCGPTRRSDVAMTKKHGSHLPALTKAPSQRSGTEHEKARCIDFLFALGSLTCHFKLVRHLEDAGYAVCTNVRNVFIHLAIPNAKEGHVAILYGDPDWLARIDGVLVQRWIAVDGACHLDADTVIHGRDGIDFDLVNDVLHASHVSRQGNRGVLVGWAIGMTA